MCACVCVHVCVCVCVSGCVQILFSSATQFRRFVLFYQTDPSALQIHVPHMTKFIEHLALDDENSDAVISASCGLIGLVSSHPQSKRIFLGQEGFLVVNSSYEMFSWIFHSWISFETFQRSVLRLRC